MNWFYLDSSTDIPDFYLYNVELAKRKMNSTVEQLLDRMKYDMITLIQTRLLTILLSERIAIRMIWLRVYYI